MFQIQLRQFAIPAEIKMAVADRCPVQPRFMHHDNNQRCASVSFIKTGGAVSWLTAALAACTACCSATSGRVAGSLAA